MSVQESPLFEAFLYFILIVKILFLISMLLALYASHKGTQSQAQKYENFQDKMEHLFIISMGILMMILFFPHTKGQVCVDGHTKSVRGKSVFLIAPKPPATSTRFL